jgi:hypothetical protein
MDTLWYFLPKHNKKVESISVIFTSSRIKLRPLVLLTPLLRKSGQVLHVPPKTLFTSSILNDPRIELCFSCFLPDLSMGLVNMELGIGRDCHLCLIESFNFNLLRNPETDGLI